MSRINRIAFQPFLKKTWVQWNNRGVILMYHRVTDPEIDPWDLCVSPSHFEEHLKIIKEYGRPIKIREMSRHLGRYSLGRKEIVVTFDDAYADNYYKAKPILEKHNVPAVFFVVTDAIGSQKEYWWDELGQIILSAEKLPEVFEMKIRGKDYVYRIIPDERRRGMDSFDDAFENNTSLSRYKLYAFLWRELSYVSAEMKKDLLYQITQWGIQPPVAREDYLPMTLEELMVLAGSPLFDLGSHTATHPMLSRLSPEEQIKEIRHSKDDLEGILGREVASFAYPHGDYSKETIGIVKSLGFDNACTIIQQPVHRHGDQYQLPRFAVRNWNGSDFEENLRSWLTGVA